MTTVFLSYGLGDNGDFVKRLYEHLTTYGHEVWWDRVSMPCRGRTFNQEIRDAIDGCERLLLVVGPHALASDYVREYYRETSDYDEAEVLTLAAGSQLVGGIDFTLARRRVYLPLVTRMRE
jgi:hypothetical protein